MSYKKPNKNFKRLPFQTINILEKNMLRFGTLY